MVNVRVDYSQRQFGQWKNYHCKRIAKQIRQEYHDYFDLNAPFVSLAMKYMRSILILHLR